MLSNTIVVALGNLDPSNKHDHEGLGKDEGPILESLILSICIWENEDQKWHVLEQQNGVKQSQVESAGLFEEDLFNDLADSSLLVELIAGLLNGHVDHSDDLASHH